MRKKIYLTVLPIAPMGFADVFQTYIDEPKRAGPLLLYHDETMLVLKDLYPKSLRHYLVLPRSASVTHIHPLKALKDPVLHDKLADYVELAKQMIVEDLVACGLVEDGMRAGTVFKETFIQCGVHSIPSMSNLHVHVMTRDFHSPRLKHKKHYNSFNTGFFVPFESFQKPGPTSDNDTEYSDSEADTVYSTDEPQEMVDEARLHALIKETPLVCSYCGRSFDSKFSELKKHLDEEFGRKFDTSKDCRPNML